MPTIARSPSTTSPVERIPGDVDSLKDATGLCLSGGGYRAMLFHAGALWRLNELGILAKVDRISSVSGGSIAAGALALAWPRLRFDALGIGGAFQDEFIKPVRKLASRTIDLKAVTLGALLPGSISDRVVGSLKSHLFGDKTLQDLPDQPRFVINASNVQSGALWRFSKPYMRDWRVGEVKSPRIPLAQAVAASAAFPPILSPLELELDEDDFTPNSGADLQQAPYTTQVVLTDGGVYDNLGLETVWKQYKRVLVSDGGGLLSAEPNPKQDWPQHAYRVLNLVDSQVRSLRKRQLIDSFKQKEREGCYWGAFTDIRDYKLPDALDCPLDQSQELARTPTRLKSMEERLQERLINWGYAVCDAATRAFAGASNEPKAKFPYAGGIE